MTMRFGTIHRDTPLDSEISRHGEQFLLDDAPRCDPDNRNGRRTVRRWAYWVSWPISVIGHILAFVGSMGFISIIAGWLYGVGGFLGVALGVVFLPIVAPLVLLYVGGVKHEWSPVLNATIWTVAGGASALCGEWMRSHRAR